MNEQEAILKDLIHIIKTNPNFYEMGEKISEFYWENKDLLEYLIEHNDMPLMFNTEDDEYE